MFEHVTHHINCYFSQLIHILPSMLWLRGELFEHGYHAHHTVFDDIDHNLTFGNVPKIITELHSVSEGGYVMMRDFNLVTMKILKWTEKESTALFDLFTLFDTSVDGLKYNLAQFSLFLLLKYEQSIVNIPLFRILQRVLKISSCPLYK